MIVFRNWIFASAFILFGFLSVDVKASAITETSFSEYIRQYQSPELFQDNDMAFQARMKLLDQAPSGSSVKILTFVFDNGEVTRRMATHICLASKRGVNVELITDSKSGDRPQMADVFDASVGNRVNEDLYQYLTNCGAKVIIHNHISDFNTVFGKNIPAVSKSGYTIAVLWNLRSLAKSFIGIVEDVLNSNAGLEKTLRVKFREAGLSANFFKEIKLESYRALVAILVGHAEDQDSVSWWQRVLGFFARIPYLLDEKVAYVLRNPDKSEEVLEESLLSIQSQLGLLQLEKITANEINLLMNEITRRYNNEPDLVEFYTNIRRFNRLNHRKLFYVKSPKGDGCIVLGGRNIGDHYMAFHPDSLLDGDVLYCDHHKETQLSVMQQASDSFEELKTSMNDDVIGHTKDTAFTEFQKVNGYQFQELMVPIESLRDPLSSTRQNKIDEKKLAKKDRTLIPPFNWSDQDKVGGISLPESENWNVKRVAWENNADKDPIREELIASIERETKEIYIETAYAEFDARIRDSIERALDRGVNVSLITNGLFITDGPSKLIRIFMGIWMREMQTKYEGKNSSRGRFLVLFSTLEGGHMIHFKGAGFRCQKKPNGDPYRSFIIGSHNFHPRSGYSDKEHALFWTQPASTECMKSHGLSGGNDAPDMIAHRHTFYRDLQVKLASKILTKYKDILDELNSVSQTSTNPKKVKSAKFLTKILYESDGKLRGGRGTELFLSLIRESGMKDFLGIVL